MNEQTRYALIGAFVLILLMAAIWFVIWMGEGLNRGAQRYWVYFDESVVGLLPKAPVTFNGVTVGDVDSIGIAPNNAKKVRVLLKINPGTPINQSTRAKLDTMGLTGVAFVELTATQANAPALQKLPGDKYPAIPAELSFLGTLSDHATTLSNNLIAVTKNINTLLNAHNQQSIEHTLQNISILTAKVPGTMKHLNTTLNALSDASDSIMYVSHSIRHTSALSQRLLTQVNQQTLPATAVLMKQISAVSKSLQDVLQTLKQHPAMLIRGKAPAALGPGE